MKQSEFVGKIPRKFNSFCHFGLESIAQSLLEGQEAENARNVEQTDEVNAVVVDETFNFPAKIMSVRQIVPMADEIVASRPEEKD